MLCGVSGGAIRLFSFGLEKNVWVTFKGLSCRVMWFNARFNLASFHLVGRKVDEGVSLSKA